VEPRERLKRYLEQRRELGERELVLDGMTVEDVMKIVGAAGRAPRAASGDLPTNRAEVSEPAAPTPARADAPPTAAHGEGRSAGGTADPTDWREALRASGVDPASGPPQVRTSSSAADRVATRKTTLPADAPPVVTPAAPADAAPVSKRYEFPRPIDTADAASAAPVGASSGASVSDAPTAPMPTPAPPAASPTAPTGIVVGVPSRELFGPADAKPASLEEIAETTRVCTRCRLYATATNAVPGEGNADAELVCVGEAPGANEDASGRPFVGQAGQLLTKILAAINLRREDVFICNVLKHRPPGNRNPLPDEVAACSPYLVQQLEVIRPKVIVAFGTFAAQTLLNTKLPIGKLRGSVHRYYGIPLIVTYHPAALLRNPAWKRPTWEDVQLARRILDSAPRT
jgi:DNA polymerase